MKTFRILLNTQAKDKCSYEKGNFENRPREVPRKCAVASTTCRKKLMTVLPCFSSGFNCFRYIPISMIIGNESLQRLPCRSHVSDA
uniref:Uncharacterized protein n=1 Tax=Trichuris muris TaxID=70415 RepID=A0A5S6Q271_TRIMR